MAEQHPGNSDRTEKEAPTYLWWQRGIVYQIYPRSFMDSDGDGVGDLRGLISRLDYLSWLGVDAIWISPFYPSPMKDFGYDVMDYTAIDPVFGTLDDFDQLMAEAHARKLKVILDFVPNHTSDEHEWFVESRSSRNSPKRDWYIWCDPGSDGGPPTNWLSCFGGSAWEYDPNTQQYYYHAFLREQPDLNWRNPEVMDAMLDILRFWLERGVDGFRIDVLWHLLKDEQLRDNPPNPSWCEGMDPYQKLIPLYTTDHSEIHAAISRLRGLVDAYPERVLIGEIYLPIERLVRYYGAAQDGVHLPFNFQLLLVNWHARDIVRIISDYEAALPEHGWPNWVLGNHDRPRIATRVGQLQARLAAMLLLTLRGTPTLYYGDELGMTDVIIPPHRARDPLERNVPGRGLGRDPQRTPMQWNNQKNAGFSTGEPWLPLASDYHQVNVEAQRDAPDSMLTFYHRLIEIRREEATLSVGRFELLEVDGGLIAYLRREGQSAFLVVLNLGQEPRVVNFSRKASEGLIMLSTYVDRSGEQVKNELQVRGEEGLLVRL